jgi:flagellar basal-body rod modification protein FlgD
MTSVTSPTTTNPTTTTTPSTTASTSSTSSSTSGTGANALSQLTSNFQTFLTLLTTQLKNQDPLSPLDSNQFTQQLVQMSGVQAQLSGNNLLQTIANNTGASVGSAVGLIGKDVRATGAAANLGASGTASWVYNLPSPASNLTLQIVNAAGQVVSAAAPSDLSAGDHSFTWNGKDLNGNPLPAGTYSLQVTAVDANNKAITASIFQDGVVTAVEQQNGSTLLTINGAQMPMNSVVNVTNPASASTSTQTAGQSTTGSNPLTSALSSAASALGL